VFNKGGGLGLGKENGGPKKGVDLGKRYSNLISRGELEPPAEGLRGIKLKQRGGEMFFWKDLKKKSGGIPSDKFF